MRPTLIASVVLSLLLSAQAAAATTLRDANAFKIDVDTAGARVCLYEARGPGDASGCEPEDATMVEGVRSRSYIGQHVALLVARFPEWRAIIQVLRDRAAGELAGGKDLDAYEQQARKEAASVDAASR